MARSASATAGENAADGRRRPPHLVSAPRRECSEPAASLGDNVLDQKPDQPADELGHQPAQVERRIGGADLADDFAGQRDGGDVVNAEQPGAQPVVDIVGVVGDVVGESGDLRLQARKTPQFQVLQARKVQDRLRHAALAIAANWLAVAIGERAVVFDQPLQRLPGEIETVEGRVAALQRRHHAQRLGVVIEAAERREALVERPLAGVAERRMAEVVGQRQAPRPDPRRGRAHGRARGRSCATSRVCVSRVRK